MLRRTVQIRWQIKFPPAVHWNDRSHPHLKDPDPMQCPHCQRVIEPDWKVCPDCQAPLNQNVSPYSSPMEVSQYAPNTANNEGDATGGIIPYKNPKALIAYYLGILSGLPLIGLPLGIAAFVLGILGLRDRKRNPVIKGSAHAWIGIGCGGIFMLLWGAITVIIAIALIAG